MLRKFNGGGSKRVWDIITGDESWIYHYDPESKRQSMVWCAQDDAPPPRFGGLGVLVRRWLRHFTKSGHIKTVPLDDRKTVNAQWYCEVCIPGVLQALREQRPKCGTRGLLWHHDNASAHTAVRTLDFLEAEGVQLLPHPPYSPDLAPCDFFLFPKVKTMLKGRQFSCDEEASTPILKRSRPSTRKSGVKYSKNGLRECKSVLIAMEYTKL